MDSTIIRPALILGFLVILIALNVIEFKGKRKRDSQEFGRIVTLDKPELLLAHRQYLQTQNIEQVLHIVNSVLIALLVAVLTA